MGSEAKEGTRGAGIDEGGRGDGGGGRRGPEPKEGDTSRRSRGEEEEG